MFDMPTAMLAATFVTSRKRDRMSWSRAQFEQALDRAESLYERLLIALHCVLTFVVLWWTLCLAWPNNLFQNSITFRVFAELAPKSVWAVLFGLAGLAGVAGLTFRHNREILVLSICILATAHGLVAAFVLSAGVASTGIGSYGGWAAVGYYLVYTIIKDRDAGRDF